ncbi:MAG: response regulator [Verrucomicrobiae bacterium]
MRILIAEDDPFSLSMLAAVLKRHGHEVVETVDGAAALAAMQAPGAPALAILDWMMPEMDGPEVVRRIRALPTDRPPYLIMLTCRIAKSDIIAGLEAGANEYLAKPFDAGELTARVDVGRQMVEMQAAKAEINGLRQRLSMSEQDERRRIAASLHDCTVQDLVAIQLNLNRAFKMLGDTQPAVREILGDCAALAESNAGELRSLAYDLHAPWLQHGGLLSGIQEYARQFSIRTGISVSFDAPPAIPRLLEMNEIALYRVMQESLMNVHRHSGANRAWISISISNNRLHMEIRDGGGEAPDSFEPPPGSASGVGILSMHERMKAIGGSLQICRTPEGASSLAILPLAENK